MKWVSTTCYQVMKLGCSTFLDDIWKYNGVNWTWMGGSKHNWQGGETPRPRQGMLYFYNETANELTLYGGTNNDYFSDLWKWQESEGWTLIKGTLSLNEWPYFDQFTPSDNTPGGRAYGALWKVSGGTIWLFGGTFFRGDTSGTLDSLKLM